MKKLFSFILSVCIISAAACNAFSADNNSASAPNATSNAATTVESIIEPTTPAVSAEPIITDNPETAAQEETVSPEQTPEITPEPTPILTPTPMPMEDFFCVMHNGSEFNYIDNGDNININPMIASNAVAVCPVIYDGITYLPFRYLFEEMLGFTDVTDKKTEPGDKEYLWSQTNVFTITFNVNGKTTVLRSGEIIKFKGSEFDSLKVSDEGVSYVPLRYFEKENLCYLDWDSNTESIIMASDKSYADSYFSKYKSQRYTNGFISYSDVIYSEAENRVISLGSKVNERVYSASNNFNLAVYSDNNQKVRYSNLDNVMANLGFDMDIYNSKGEKLDVLVDRLTVYGDMIYGVVVTKDNQLSGHLFSAKLRLQVTENKSGAHFYKIQARDYKEITQSDGIIMFDIEGKLVSPDIYYVDANDSYTLHKLNVKSGDVVQITIDGSPIKNIDYFAIGKNSIAYNDFAEREVKCGKFDGNTIMGVSTAEKVDIIQFISYDSKNDCFYYVTTTEDVPNAIKCVSLADTNPKQVFEEEKIRCICVIDGSVYAKVNGKLTKCY